VKRIVEWIMGNLAGTLSIDASNPTVQHGGSVSDVPKRMTTVFLHGYLILLHGVIPKSPLSREKQMICPL